MKKVTLMFALAATLFAACGKDNETTNTPDEPQVPAIVSMDFHLDATDDMLHFLDYTVIYDDGTGEREESVTSKRWEKTLTSTLPATFTIRRHLRVKEGMYDAFAATDTVYFTEGYGFVYQILDSTNTAIPGMSDSWDRNPTTGGRGARMAEHCQAGDLDKTYTLSFDINGHFTQM